MKTQLEEIRRLADDIIKCSRQREAVQNTAAKIIEVTKTIEQKPRDPQRDWKLTRIRALAESLGADQAAIDIADICNAELS